jgi:hypothetical protein
MLSAQYASTLRACYSDLKLGNTCDGAPNDLNARRTASGAQASAEAIGAPHGGISVLDKIEPLAVSAAQAARPAGVSRMTLYHHI